MSAQDKYSLVPRVFWGWHCRGFIRVEEKAGEEVETETEPHLINALLDGSVSLNT